MWTKINIMSTKTPRANCPAIALTYAQSIKHKILNEYSNEQKSHNSPQYK